MNDMMGKMGMKIDPFAMMLKGPPMDGQPGGLPNMSDPNKPGLDMMAMMSKMMSGDKPKMDMMSMMSSMMGGGKGGGGGGGGDMMSKMSSMMMGGGSAEVSHGSPETTDKPSSPDESVPPYAKPPGPTAPMWNKFVENMVPAITRVVRFCKKIPGTFTSCCDY